MKQFFESYGGVALGILALLVLIAMITPVGNIIKTSLQGTTNKFASSMNGQLDDAMVATAEAQESAVKEPVDLTNINKSGVIGDFSTKGNLVEINDVQFRVLEVNGSQVKVLSMTPYKKSKYNSSDTFITEFYKENGTLYERKGQKYIGSLLDQEMQNYYLEMPESIQNAIINTALNQNLYNVSKVSSDSETYTSFYKENFRENTNNGQFYLIKKVGYSPIGERKVFALDVEDVLMYLGESFTPQDLNDLFFQTRTAVSSKIVWLRSVSSTSLESNGSGKPFSINGNYGLVNEGFTCLSYNVEVRPAFVIDLSLL